MRNLSPLVIAATLGGCNLYFGSQNQNDHWSYCGSDGQYDCVGDNCKWVSPTCTGGNGSGYACTTSTDCAAGCYCANGMCTEGGFCATDADCGSGFHCDTSRSSCVPNPPNTCNYDNQCAQGQYCAPSTNTCTATCTCTNDAQAISAGFGWCDTTRDTCLPGQNPAGTCAGDVSATCSTAEPQCPTGQVPLLIDSCWNGNCVAYASCNLPPVCSHINDEMDCLNRSDCSGIYDGIACTKPDGSACHSGDTNCTCQSYVFAACANKTGN
jgi:hypothetical protein